MKPILSISIPTYAVPKEVIRTVNHLLECKRNDIEIVVTDNDSKGEHIKDYMLTIKDSRLKYYQNEKNLGRSYNIVKAVEMASADYVCLCSSEDVILLDSIDVIVEAIQEGKYSAILGNLNTTMGVKYLDRERAICKAGFEALIRDPSFGNLVPVVVNKTYIDFSELYSVKETYMQRRILYHVYPFGDVLFTGVLFGIIPDNAIYRTEISSQLLIDPDLSKNDFGKTGCYYHPYERAEQIKGCLDLVEKKYDLDLRQILRLVDGMVASAVRSSISYVFQCQDYYFRYKINPPVIGYDESFRIFMDAIYDYFENKSKEGKYSYTGKLCDRIENEKILLRKAENILDRIQCSNSVYVYNADENAVRLYVLIKKIGIATKGFIAEEKRISFIHDDLLRKDCGDDQEAVVLVSDYYDREMEAKLHDKGIYEIFFLNRLVFYLAAVWCDRHQDVSNFGEYSKYVFEPIDSLKEDMYNEGKRSGKSIY